MLGETLANLGENLCFALLLEEVMGEAGFLNMTTPVNDHPIGPWAVDNGPKTIGILWRNILLEGLQAMALGPSTKGLG